MKQNWSKELRGKIELDKEKRVQGGLVSGIRDRVDLRVKRAGRTRVKNKKAVRTGVRYQRGGNRVP